MALLKLVVKGDQLPSNPVEKVKYSPQDITKVVQSLYCMDDESIGFVLGGAISVLYLRLYAIAIQEGPVDEAEYAVNKLIHDNVDRAIEGVKSTGKLAELQALLHEMMGKA